MGHPSYFQRLPRLGSVTARQSSSERQPNFAALNRGRHLCSAGRPSRWALAHISSLRYFTAVGSFRGALRRPIKVEEVYRRKKFTFAISSADEFLLLTCSRSSRGEVARSPSAVKPKSTEAGKLPYTGLAYTSAYAYRSTHYCLDFQHITSALR